MGAVSISVEAQGKNMEDAFRNACKKAEIEIGTDPYNGGINNCELKGSWTHKYNKRNGKCLSELFDEATDYCYKREVIGICTKEPKKNTNKIKSTVNRTPQKGTRKWDTVYVGHVRELGYEEMVEVCCEKTLGECIKKARIHTEKTQNPITITIEKRLRAGNVICATVEYKHSKSENLGTYVFVGMAPY